MKTMLGLTAGLLSLLPPTAAQVARKPAATPARILVTLRVLEVPGSDYIDLSIGPRQASALYDRLMHDTASEAMEVSVQAPADFPGIARYSRTFAFKTQDHGKPSRNFLIAPTSLEATPHINANGTITVSLKTQVTQVVSQASDMAPATLNQSINTQRTFKSGDTLLLGIAPTSMGGGKPGATAEPAESLQFVTVMALPSEVAAR